MSNPVPLELQSKISAWRLRAADGSLSLEEMKEAILHLRAGRVAAASTQSAARKTAKKSVAPGAEDMLSELDDL